MPGSEPGSASAPRYGGGRLLRVGRYRFERPFGLILTAAIFQLAAPEEDWARWVTIVLQAGVVLAALEVARSSPRVRDAAALALGAVVVVSGIVAIVAGGLGGGPGRLIALALVVLAPAAIVHALVAQVREEGITVETMLAGLSLYLLAGIGFAFLFGAIDEIGSTPFFASGRSGTPSEFLYYSFTTMTTTGYGDFTAGTAVGRAVSVTEALAGQIYLVTVVALIVGNLGWRANRPR